MRFATVRLERGRTQAVRMEGDQGILLPYDDVGQMLRSGGGGENGPSVLMTTAELAPVVPRPNKIFCVGLNYRSHIAEMAREMPQFPTLFAKFADVLIGARDPIRKPSISDTLDWECELAVVVGSSVYDVDVAEGAAAIGGYAVFNDVSVREFQNRTAQWLQGKNFEGTTAFGPVIVTPDEFSLDAEITTRVDGEVVQRSRTSDLLFKPAELVSYISRFITLYPGDVIATGTPGGVGHAAHPPRYLRAGQVVEASIEGIGSLVNHVVDAR